MNYSTTNLRINHSLYNFTKIKVSFDVSSALGAGIDSGNNCLMWPEEPVVTISLTE